MKPTETIFETEKKAKLSATKVLKIAKEQEAEKLKNGYHYVSVDCKTLKLIKDETT